MRAFRIIFISLVAVLTFLSWFYGERPDNSYGPGAESSYTGTPIDVGPGVEVIGDSSTGLTFEDISQKAACDTDLELSADPETPDHIRELLFKSIDECRTRAQVRALDAIAERIPGAKP